MTVRRPTPSRSDSSGPPTPFSRIIGQSRFTVLLAVVSVLLVAAALFLIGVIQALTGIYNAAAAVADLQFNAANLTLVFLEIVSTMLKAVVF